MTDDILTTAEAWHICRIYASDLHHEQDKAIDRNGDEKPGYQSGYVAGLLKAGELFSDVWRRVVDEQELYYDENAFELDD